MASNVPMDHYKLVLEAVPFKGVERPATRALATNTATQSTVEVQLSIDQTRALLEHAYGGEPSIVENYLELLKDGHVVELLATNKHFCVFAGRELVQFGFDPERLQM